jgi:hypothetical protein
LGFNDLDAWQIVYGESLLEYPTAWNVSSRVQIISKGHPFIYQPCFYSTIPKPRLLQQILNQAMTSEGDNVFWQIFEAPALRGHIKEGKHLRAGDQTWALVLSALRSSRWSLVPRLMKDTLFIQGFIPFNVLPALAPHVGIDALRARVFHRYTPPLIKILTASVLRERVDCHFPSSTKETDAIMVEIFKTFPNRYIYSNALLGLATGQTQTTPMVKFMNPLRVCQMEKWIQPLTLDHRLGILDDLIRESRGPLPSVGGCRPWPSGQPSSPF